MINLRFGRSNGKKLRTARTELNPDEFGALEKTLYYKLWKNRRYTHNLGLKGTGPLSRKLNAKEEFPVVLTGPNVWGAPMGLHYIHITISCGQAKSQNLLFPSTRFKQTT